MKFATLSVLLVAMAAPIHAQSLAELPPAWSVTPALVTETWMYSEGPAFGPDGTFYLSLHERGEVWRLGADGSLEIWLDRTNGANGHVVTDDGMHILMSRPRVLWLDAGGTEVAALDGYEGEPFVFPNDLLLDGEGGFWFTDSGAYQEATGRVFHVDADRNLRLVAEGLHFANGLVRSLDGGTLFVAESLDNDILAYNVADDLSLSNERVFIALPEEELWQRKDMPDGICRDGAGRLFIAHNGTGMLRVVSPEGDLLVSYRTGLDSVSNCTFGPDGAIYLTGAPGHEMGAGAIHRLDLGHTPAAD